MIQAFIRQDIWMAFRECSTLELSFACRVGSFLDTYDEDDDYAAWGCRITLKLSFVLVLEWRCESKPLKCGLGTH